MAEGAKKPALQLTAGEPGVFRDIVDADVGRHPLTDEPDRRAQIAIAHRKRIRGFAPRALDVLLSYPWPGNVRQLENCIEQAVVLCEDETIGVEALSLSENVSVREGESFIRIRSGLPLRDVEQEYILRTLQETGGNRTRAARVGGRAPARRRGGRSWTSTRAPLLVEQVLNQLP